MFMMTSQNKLREKWPWNSEFLRVFTIVSVVIGIVAAGALYPLFGFNALYFLLAVPCCLLPRFIYGMVGKKVAALRDSTSVQDGEVVESLMVIGRIQSPGVAVLRGSELILSPIVGKGCTVPLGDIISVRESSWLPGKYLWGKKAFLLDTPNPTRLAFAVPESIGKRWSKKLARAAEEATLKQTALMSDYGHELHATESRYPTKIDLWLGVLLLSFSLFCLYVPIILFSEPVHLLVKILGSIFFLAMAGVIPWILFGTLYILTKEHLIIRCLSMRYPIPLSDIYEVFPTHNPLSAPACSLDRLRVKFEGSRFGALISPKDKTEFIHDLLSRCPQLIRDNNRLILRPDT
jgi:hypothetical protein